VNANTSWGQWVGAFRVDGEWMESGWMRLI
jgi:hypothetical protein